MEHETDPPFGALAPSGFEARVRAIGHRLPNSAIGRKLASAILGPAGGRRRRALDVSIFGNQRARLYPFDNICEKRVYLTPQQWDQNERALLTKIIKADKGPFTFLDIGANAGLYSLFARSVAQEVDRAITIIAVEPDEQMRQRMTANFAYSGAMHEVEIFPFAAAAREGVLNFTVEPESRGMSRLDEAGDTKVEARTILLMLHDADVKAPPIMKIDIEGAEFPALEAFFRDAPKNLWPSHIFTEIAHETTGNSVEALCTGAGYKALLKTRLNTVLARTPI